MKVSWLSGRVLGNDLCGTTQTSIAEELCKLGHTVNLYSPGQIETSQFRHIQIPRGSIKGLHSSTVVRSLRSKIKDINSSDHVLIDWRLHAITPLITVPWTLIDRGPPADRNFLSWFQWIQWKRAWKKTTYGTAVSQAHAEFINLKTKTHLANIAIIQAGVDTEMFRKGTKSGGLKLSYQGRVDKHRGVMALPKILEILNEKGVDASLHIHGDGNALIALQKLDIPNLHVTSTVSSSTLAEKLSNYDVGFLPMPESNVWKLASPLKRSEYLASGMIICGIDHTGHRIQDSGDWIQLFSQQRFIVDCSEWLAGLDRESLQKLQDSSRHYAVENLLWSSSAKVLVESISS
ncbi:MAG: hypothetical protein CMI27_02455 [Opitutae bacterium]|nr:hypothetical protein [Opitutae bacterium]